MHRSILLLLVSSPVGCLAQTDLPDLGADVTEITLSDTPHSLFVNWRIHDSMVAEFEQTFVDYDFKLAPVRLLEGEDEPHYWLSMNTYRCSLFNIPQLRVEYSVYIHDNCGGVSMYVYDAMADIALGRPDSITHEIVDEQLVTSYAGENFEYDAVLPLVGNGNSTRLHAEFVAANDRFYWPATEREPKKVDKSYYDGKFWNAEVIDVNSYGITRHITGAMAKFIKEEAGSAWWYPKGMNYVVKPRFNDFDAICDL